MAGHLRELRDDHRLHDLGAGCGGPHRAFSIAFLVPVVLYLGIVVTNSRNELSYGYGKLPTSRFFQVFLEQENDHLSSGEIIKERQARAESLMPCGHAAVAVLLGYVAGKYGRAVYGWTRRAEGQIARG